MNTRVDAIHQAQECFDSGDFRRMLARRIAIPTESQNPERAGVLRDYLEEEIRPAFEAMGFSCRILQHPKALAPFGQVRGVLSREHQGTGLGLPLVKSLAELHGGTLDLASQPGKGTVATINLPLRDPLRVHQV